MSYARVILMAAAIAMCGTAWAQPQQRLIHVISDLHFGVGDPDARPAPPPGLPCEMPDLALPELTERKWLDTEDFRWPVALCGFLDEVGSKPEGAIVVIAGDFLELWQHPQYTCVQDAQPDCGCTVKEMEPIVTRVLDAHQREFGMFRDFLARNPRNHLVVVPGNHDAALMHDDIWKLVSGRIPAAAGQLVRAESGTWMSDDKKVAVEHGHQQSLPDVNAFPEWAQRKVTRQCRDGQERFFAPWGEHFVSKLYSQIEFDDFPLIDNLVPDSVGVATYYAYAKEKKIATGQIAKFVYFNVFETSWRQKEAILDVGYGGVMTDDDVEKCVKCIGQEELVLRDALRNPQVKAFLTQQSVSASQLKSEMAEERKRMLSGKDLPMDYKRALCQREAIAELGKQGGEWSPMGPDGKACPIKLGTAAARLADPTGAQMLANRVEELRVQTGGRLGVYVFGHTHEAKLQMDVVLDPRTIAAFNTGAFHRQLDQVRFEKRLSQNTSETDAQFLKRLKHQDLAACYSVVTITPRPAGPVGILRQWVQAEDAARGSFVEACSAVCTSKPANCEKSGS